MARSARHILYSCHSVPGCSDFCGAFSSVEFWRASFTSLRTWYEILASTLLGRRNSALSSEWETAPAGPSLPSLFGLADVGSHLPHLLGA
jgi:hypothetical protein